jgi:hypothetical protein
MIKKFISELNKEQKNILLIIIICSALIIFITGYLIGNIFIDKTCQQNPFFYGLKEMNKLNNANFFCECTSFTKL